MKNNSNFLLGMSIGLLAFLSFSQPVKKSANGPNPVVHFEIGCKNLTKTTDFYTSLFGWTPTNAGIASYINTNSTDGIQGHIAALGHEPNNYVTVYIQVDNIDDYLRKIETAGGKKVVGPIKLPSGQQFAWFRDPEDNLMGLLTKQ